MQDSHHRPVVQAWAHIAAQWRLHVHEAAAVRNGVRLCCHGVDLCLIYWCWSTCPNTLYLCCASSLAEQSPYLRVTPPSRQQQGSGPSSPYSKASNGSSQQMQQAGSSSPDPFSRVKLAFGSSIPSSKVSIRKSMQLLTTHVVVMTASTHISA